MIKARRVTVFSKPAFKAAIRQRRCLIPASGFFEWERGERVKQPFLVQVQDAELFATAGLWDRWKSSESGEVIESCAILTTRSNSVLCQLHDRMPVILSPGSYDLWLEPGVKSREELAPLMEPVPYENTIVHPVSREVNNPANDNPSVIQPSDG
jgi:putative SOS response-associated peptidase YedK